LRELKMPAPLAPRALSRVLREVLARNKVRDGYVYAQVTRGVAPRDHAFPARPVRPSLVVTAKAIDPEKGAQQAARGIKVISLPDIRWKRPDIKTINLLPNVLARQAAKEQGAYEAWLIDAEGMVVEGAASNAWIVTPEKIIVTHQVDQSILQGVTRTTLLDLIAAKGYRLEERRFSLDEAKHAEEAFITGATTLVMPVIAIDDTTIGDGKPGALATSLRAQFHNFARATL
jgi:D-alanine transaminase